MSPLSKGRRVWVVASACGLVGFGGAGAGFVGGRSFHHHTVEFRGCCPFILHHTATMAQEFKPMKNDLILRTAKGKQKNTLITRSKGC